MKILEFIATVENYEEDDGTCISVLQVSKNLSHKS